MCSSISASDLLTTAGRSATASASDGEVTMSINGLSTIAEDDSSMILAMLTAGGFSMTPAEDSSTTCGSSIRF